MRDNFVQRSTIKLLKARTERMWIEENKDINILNYWYYKYFTHRYRNYLLWYFNFKSWEEDIKIAFEEEKAP